MTAAASSDPARREMRENRKVAPFVVLFSACVNAAAYAVYASIALEAWSIVSATGNDRLNALPPIAVVK